MSGSGSASYCRDVVVLLLVLVLVLDPFGNTLFFEYENEGDDEKISIGHIRHLPLMKFSIFNSGMS